MMRRVVTVVLLGVVVAGLLLFFGPLVRGLTLGAIVAGLIWYGIGGPSLLGRHGRSRPYRGDRRSPARAAPGSGWAREDLHGFRNEQTWLVASWLDSDSSFHHDVDRIAGRESDVHKLGLRLRTYVGEHFEPDLIDDLASVDWDEIGAAWMEKAGKDESAQS
jgi:hypothetical protein